MANQHEHIDLTTLQEVERLLTSTELAAADDSGSRGLGAGPTTLGRSNDHATGASEGMSALPRRR
jgi:hypothetical protein